MDRRRSSALGVRVLDLSRVIAAPVAGRTLAAHGADVLLVYGPNLPAIDWLTIDTGRGKLSTFIELKSEAGRATMRDLLAQADIFSQGYRPQAFAKLGFSPEEVAKLSPGIVYVTLSAYGHAGPWAGRRGFDSLVQTSTGFNHAEGAAAGVEGPKELPAQMLDHATGYLMAFGAMMAKARQRARGRKLARPRLAGADRALAVESRPRRKRFCASRPEERSRRALHGRRAVRLRHAACRAPLGDPVEDAGALGAARGAARHRQGRMAGALEYAGAAPDQRMRQLLST